MDDLIDKKQVSRKKAVEGVTALLEMADRRQKLCDAEWLQLVRSAVACAKYELAVGAKGCKAPRREYGDFVERVVKWADATSETGGRRLGRCAKPLVTHVVDTLAGGDALVVEGFGAAYARLLEHLLGVPEYVSALPVADLVRAG